VSDLATRRARLEPLLVSARSLADGTTERGQLARARLIAASGLSAEGVELALTHCLEIAPNESEIEALIRSTPTAQVAHVLLSANVFVAAHRAIAIGLAASDTVRVRASRREPEMAGLLLAGAPGAFQLVNELSPHSGDRLWAYGSDRTLEEVAVTLSPGVAFHGHGSGFGVGVIDGTLSDSELRTVLLGLARDIALFDQRGCLSPRVLLLNGGSDYGREVARALAVELSLLEQRVPRGRMDPEELAEITSYRDTASFSGEIVSAGSGFVSVGEHWLMPPVGRNLHVLLTSDIAQSLNAVRPLITSSAFAGSAAQRNSLRGSLRGARFCSFGRMQSPPFDGPVDLRDQ
jgi:Acyl-CoA reductase (LuxC)